MTILHSTSWRYTAGGIVLTDVAVLDGHPTPDPQILTDHGIAHSDDHTFVDTADTAIAGRADCTSAWRGFFSGFPDYRNVFTTVSAGTDPATGTDVVQA